MKLFIRVIQARNLPAVDPNGFSNPFVKLQLGKQKFKTKVKKKSLNPSWWEEFIFKVDSVEEDLLISLFYEDKYHDEFIGQITLSVHQVLEARDKSLGTNWYILQPKSSKSKNKFKDCGEILLMICFLQSNLVTDSENAADRCLLLPGMNAEVPVDSPSRPLSISELSPSRSEDDLSNKDEKPSLANRIAQLFNKNTDTFSVRSVEANNASELPDSVVGERSSEELVSSSDFRELLKTMEMRDQVVEVPIALPGHVVIDELYGSAPDQLNSLLFSSDSGFLNSLAEIQGSTDLQIGQWKFEDGNESLKRVVSYTKASSKLIKALKTIEEQTYIKADSKAFAILSTVKTPDAPYGNTFKVEVLYSITPDPDLPFGDPSSRLEVSWRVNFLQSSMMKSLIESGTKQGIKESFEQYKNLLSQKIKTIDVKKSGSDKDQVLESLPSESQSDWKMAVQYFANFSVISTILMSLYVFIHIWLAMPSTIQGLEFGGLDLPDSLGEFLVSGLLFLQGKRLFESLTRFMQARSHKESDHGIKAQGDGWLLTVALIEGTGLAAVNSSGFSDPYVVFTCNGKIRTSSVKFMKTDPIWNEFFEFDAMDEPPSVLTVEVFEFHGPFDEATSLGFAEINFLRSNFSELSDIWIPLQGKLAQACQSKLHLRIFLNNNKGSSLHKDFITKMEKEVGKKIKLRSPQTNSAFQKLFELPPEEFLINDFACHLKRKMPLKGRLFLSTRIIGFHADIFGHKTKFFFLWEDIEDIEVIPPTLSSIGSPIIVVTLRPGRGLDSLHGAKSVDFDSRLKYHFHSFVSFNIAHRTIMALWRAKSLTPEQKVQILEDESEPNSIHIEDETMIENLKDGDHGSDDAQMSVVYSSLLSFPTMWFMELFNGGEIERRSMERVGSLNYSHSPWESEKQQRQLYYKFDKPITPYRGEVTSIQHKSRVATRNSWLVEEIITLHDVPFWDFFNVQLRYRVDDIPSKQTGCNVQVHIKVVWLKYMKHQKQITKSITSNFQRRVKAMVCLLEEEYVSVRSEERT